MKIHIEEQEETARADEPAPEREEPSELGPRRYVTGAQLERADVARREGLDPGLAVQFAVVHDVPETYAGDTCTARGLSPDAAAEKAAREAASLERLRAELGPCWTTDMVDRYEAQREPEARLVRYLDKVLPKLTHVLNGGLALAEIGMSAREVETKHAEQGAKLRALYPEMVATRALFDEACALALDAMRKHEAASPLPEGGTSCPDCKGTGVLHFAGETDPTNGVTERLQEPCHCTEGVEAALTEQVDESEVQP